MPSVTRLSSVVEFASSHVKRTVRVCTAISRVQALWSRSVTTETSNTRAVLKRLVDHEQRGVPRNAGKTGEEAFDLAAFRSLLNKLGEPQKTWTAVHVAGTKGKGSTAAAIANIARLASIRAGLYTSPHITSITERIQVSGTHISEQEFQQLAPRHAEGLNQASKGIMQVTHFEMLTALAFQHFKDEQVQLGVIETGLGGTSDATNVIEGDNLACAVITAIDMEHLQALGGSLKSIAQAKAGIMKPNRPVIIAHQPHAEALQVLQWHAQQLQCPVVRPQDIVQLEPCGYEHPDGRVVQCARAVPQSSGWLQPTDLKLPLLGRHQLDNAAAAIACASVLREQGLGHITQASIRQGLEQTQLPGRLQVVPLNTTQSSHGWLVLDGAHTAHSAAALSETVRHIFPGSPMALVVAMADDKEHKAVMAALRSTARPAVVIFTTVPIAGSSHRSCSPGTLAAHWQAAGLSRPKGQPVVRSRELIQASMSAALERAQFELKASEGPGVVVVCGSLHAVAEAQKVLRSAT